MIHDPETEGVIQEQYWDGKSGGDGSTQWEYPFQRREVVKYNHRLIKLEKNARQLIYQLCSVKEILLRIYFPQTAAQHLLEGFQRGTIHPSKKCIAFS